MFVVEQTGGRKGAKMANKTLLSYGTYVDRINGKCPATAKEGYKKLLKQISERGYKELNDAARLQYEAANNLSLHRWGMPAKTTEKKQYWNVLSKTQRVVLIGYSAKDWYGEAQWAMKNGTPVTIGFINPDAEFVVKDVTTLHEIDEAHEPTRIARLEWSSDTNYEDWEKDVYAAKWDALNAPIHWVKPNYRIHTLRKEFPSEEAFLDYLQAEIDRIEEQGEYDVTVSSDITLVEKLSCARFVRTKGMNKGQRDFWCSATPDIPQYWTNYKVRTEDIIWKYVHLTFLEAASKLTDGLYPLVRIHTLGDEYDGKEYWRGTAYEDMVRTTPIYVEHDTYEELKKPAALDDVLDVMPEDVQEVVRAMGIDTIKSLGYDEALKSIRFNLNNR